MEFASLLFVEFSKQIAACGWRFDHLLPAEDPDQSVIFSDPRYFSTRRQVTVEAFTIATSTIPLSHVLPFEYSLRDTHGDIGRLCEVVNSALAPYKLRLPNEDEFELAFGNQLFPWGDEIPSQADFEKDPPTVTSHGLQFAPDSRRGELVCSTLKFCDGGESSCGGYAWPAQWLCFSPSFCHNRFSISGWERIDIRPVKVS